MPVTPAIPASEIVAVNPSVLAAGGNALDLIGLILTQNYRVPVGQVLNFPSATAVGEDFGVTANLTALATVYFLGFDNSNVKPGNLLFSRYCETPVGAWLQGGDISGMPLSQLQGLDGTLSVVIDGVTKSGTVNLATATSFSNAAQIIETALGLSGTASASVTGSIGGTFTASVMSAGNLMNVTAVLSGSLQPGDTVTGTDGTNSLQAGTTVLAQLTGTPGAIGTYALSKPPSPGNMVPSTVTSVSTILNVTAVTSGTIAVADILQGVGITANTYIASQLAGTTGGVGQYSLGGNAGQTIASEGIELVTSPVQYDSVTGAFWFFSATVGPNSSLAYATGQLAASLLLTQATGAILSQGAAADTPATRMAAITATTQDWASFMTDWEPTDTEKEGFATWVNGTNNGYVYEMWDTNIVNTESGASPSAAVAFINNSNASGIDMMYSNPAITILPGEKAAFQMGATASIDFTETNGRITFAGKSQTGLLPDVTSGTIAETLAGNPQTATFGNGLNFYGDYTTRNQAFIWWQRGLISGPFRWKDSYVNQIWLNNQLQLALMLLIANTKSIPYNQAGYALIEAACLDPITQAVTFGAIAPGVPLSAAQAAEVNQAAGVVIDSVLSTRGWYLQVNPALPQVRAFRGSPPCTLWYVDGQSVQAISLASILIA